MHECCPQHLRTGATRMQYDIDAEEEGMNRYVITERNKASTKWSPKGIDIQS